MFEFLFMTPWASHLLGLTSLEITGTQLLYSMRMLRYLTSVALNLTVAQVVSFTCSLFL